MMCLAWNLLAIDGDSSRFAPQNTRLVPIMLFVVHDTLLR
jgi:hypothetical protein